MAGCAAQRFQGIGPAIFACLQAKGAAAGIPIEGAQGQAIARGVTIRWDFDVASEVLVIECLNKPSFISCSTLESAVRELIEGCKPRSG